MKNNILLLIALCTMGYHGAKASTVLLSQDFESGSLPSGWSKTQFGATAGWEFGNINYVCGNNFPASSKFAISRDCSYEPLPGVNINNASLDRLITPAMNLSTYDGIVLSFDYSFSSYEKSSATIEFTIDGGANWMQLKKLPRTIGWTKMTLVLQGIKYSNIKLCFRHNDGNTDAYYFAMDNLVIRTADKFDLSGIAINTNEYLKKGSQPLSAKFVNLGSTKIQNLVFNYTLDGTNYVSKTLSNLNILPNDTVDLIVDSFAALNDIRPYPTCITIMKANGFPNSGTFNNTLCKLLQPMAYFPARKHVVEIGAETGNTNYLNVIRFYDTLAKKHFPDMIPVFLFAQKYNYTLYSEDAKLIDTAMRINGYGCMIDRERNSPATYNTFQYGMYQFEKHYKRFQDTVSPAEISMENIEWDSKLRKFKCLVKVRFLATFNGDARMNLYVIEDSVLTGSPTGDLWNPDNAVVGSQYYNAGSIIKNYPFPSVMRAAIGGYQGQNQVIPNYVPAAGKEYYYQFESFVPIEWRENKIRLVAMVNNWDNSFSFRRILNATDKMLIADPSLSTRKISGLQNLITYPNPATEAIHVKWQGKNPEKMELVSTTGKIVSVNILTEIAGNEFTIPVSGLENGLYFLRITGNGMAETRSINIMK